MIKLDLVGEEPSASVTKSAEKTTTSWCHLRRRTIYEVLQKEIARTILFSNPSTQFSSGLPIQIVSTLSKSQFVPHIASITQKTYISGFKSFVVGSRASGSVRSLRWYTAHITVIVVIWTLRVSGTKRIFSSWWAFMLRFQTTTTTKN